MVVFVITVKNVPRRPMGDEQIKVFRYGRPYCLFVYQRILKRGAAIIGSVRRCKYFESLYFDILMF